MTGSLRYWSTTLLLVLAGGCSPPAGESPAMNRTQAAGIVATDTLSQQANIAAVTPSVMPVSPARGIPASPSPGVEPKADVDSSDDPTEAGEESRSAQSPAFRVPYRPYVPHYMPQSLDLPPSKGMRDAPAFPPEVTTFMVDRDSCDHFRSEDAYDAERAAYLAQNVRDLCTGTDAKLATLRRRYAQDPDVVAALGNYEDRIEAPEEP